MSIAVDFAWYKPSIASMHSWGAIAAGMYVSHDPTKNASGPLVNSYAANGIRSFIFFEDTADRARGGYAAGTADAKFAMPLVNGYGMPSWAPVIVTADFDVPDYAPGSSDPLAKLGPVGQYFKAWCDTIGAKRVAAYGSFYLCQRTMAAKVASYAVQTLAWSGGQVLPGIALYQNGSTLAGGNVDVDTIVSPELLSYISWVPGQADPHASSTIHPDPEKEDDMPILEGLAGDHNTWVVLPVPTGKANVLLYADNDTQVRVGFHCSPGGTVIVSGGSIDVQWTNSPVAVPIPANALKMTIGGTIPGSVSAPITVAWA